MEEFELDEKEEQEKLVKEAIAQKHRGWFHVGQEFMINGWKFRINRVKPTEISFKLLPKDRQLP